MRPVNLLPDARHDASSKAFRYQRRRRIVSFVVLGLLAAAVLVLGVEYFQARGDVSDSRTALTTAQKELADVQVQAAAPSAAEAALQARLTAATTVSSSRVQWDGLLADLARVMPPGAWLTSLTAQSPGSTVDGAAAVSTPATGAAAATQTPTAFVIGGYAFSQAIVAQALERLALVPQLTNVTLQQTQRAEVFDRTAIQFGIVADVRPRGGTGS